MPNPIEQVVALAKKGDRRVLLGGAAVIGGSVGLIVYARSRRSGAGGLPTLSPAAATASEFGDGGDGGAGGGADISSLFDEGQAGAGLSLPVLDSLSAPGELLGSTLPSNLAETAPIGLPELPTITAAPYFGSLPTLPAFEQPPSYTGGAYGNALTGGVSEAPVLQSALGGLRAAPSQTQAIQTATSREIKAEAYTPSKPVVQPTVAREIAAEIYTAPSREIAAVSTPRTVQAEVYAPGQGAVLGGFRESAADYYRRATAYVERARQVQVQAQATARSNMQIYTPAARQATPTVHTAPTETYTAPARTVKADTYTAPARQTTQPAAARSTVVVKPRSRLEELR